MQKAVFAFMDASPGRIYFSVDAFMVHPTRTRAPMITAHAEASLRNTLIQCNVTRSIAATDMDLHA
jgi:hypothetical protein